MKKKRPSYKEQKIAEFWGKTLKSPESFIMFKLVATKSYNKWTDGLITFNPPCTLINGDAIEFRTDFYRFKIEIERLPEPKKPRTKSKS